MRSTIGRCNRIGAIAAVADRPRGRRTPRAAPLLALTLAGICPAALADADLTLALSAFPDPVAVGGRVAYTALIDNTGPAGANDVEVAINLPATALFHSAFPSQGSCAAPAAGVLECALGFIGVGETVRIDLELDATDAAELNVQATVTTSSVDPDETDNADSATATAMVIANEPPGAFSLLSPADGAARDRVATAFDWSDAADPEGGPIRYRFAVFDSDTGALVHQQYVVPNPVTGVTRSSAYTLSELSNRSYRWRVEAIDAVGLVTPSTEEFDVHLEFPTGGVLTGLVQSDAGLAEIAGASVTLGDSGLTFQTELDGSFVFATGDATYTLNVSADGFVEQSIEVEIIDSEIRQLDNIVLLSDTDGDGTPNTVDDDDDGDGLNDVLEAALGSDPLDPDTDDDTVADGADNCVLAANADQTDADGDGAGNACDADDDDDGMPDAFESAHGFDPLNAADAGADADGDGFSNLREYRAGTDPLDPASFPAGLPPWLPLLLDD
jgi:hypothetical protein